jgi:AMP deaminase
MTSKHLLDFIKEKVKHHGDDVVSTNADGSAVTLASVFQKLSLNVDAFTLNALDTRADNTFERFDHFNAKYNPFGKSELRDVFLKSDNKMNGRYYAEITQQLFNKLEKSKYIAGEYRISIYGNKRTEWDSLANWVLSNKLVSPMQRWLIQIPRIFFVFKKFGAVHSFQQVIDNIFGPLFEVTADPSSHPQLHAFLNQVSGFDSVDDESRPERKFDEMFVGGVAVLEMPNTDFFRCSLAQTLPADWTSIENPPYAYYSYYFYANITALNAFRRARGFSAFFLAFHKQLLLFHYPQYQLTESTCYTTFRNV